MALPPRTLDYQSPRNTPSQTRQVAAQFARWNGIVTLLLGMSCLTVIVPSFDPHSHLKIGTALDVALFLAYDAASLVCGILYIIGGVVIRRPNHRWETTLMVGAVIHGVMVLLMLSRLIYAVATFRGGPNAASLAWGLGLHALLGLSIGIMFDQVRIARGDESG